MQKMDPTEFSHRYQCHDEHEAWSPRRLHWLNNESGHGRVWYGGPGIRMGRSGSCVIMRGEEWGANNCSIEQLIAVRLC